MIEKQSEVQKKELKVSNFNNKKRMTKTETQKKETQVIKKKYKKKNDKKNSGARLENFKTFLIASAIIFPRGRKTWIFSSLLYFLFSLVFFPLSPWLFIFISHALSHLNFSFTLRCFFLFSNLSLFPVAEHYEGRVG